MSDHENEVLRLERLRLGYGQFIAVSEVSFGVQSEKILAIIGPNGAGKSTLFDGISGALKPLSGNVFLDGIDISRYSAFRRARAGLIRSFQITNLFQEMSVRDNLRLALQQSAEPRTLWRRETLGNAVDLRLEQVAGRFGLEEKLDLAMGKLSHGEQRKLEMAMTIATEPRIALLDEPTQGMSQFDRLEMMELIRQISETTKIILIEHDVELVLELADRIIVMADGRIIADGDSSHIHENPAVQEAYFGT